MLKVIVELVHGTTRSKRTHVVRYMADTNISEGMLTIYLKGGRHVYPLIHVISVQRIQVD